MDRYKKQRMRMVETQIRARSISDTRVLKVMETVPRHLFVDEGLIDQAYNDNPLPIGEHQTISQPYIVALMTDLIDPQPGQTVLEIGTGSGYHAAILSRLCQKVYTVERLDALVSRARKVFDRLRYHNIISRIDDGTEGWPSEAPFDRIIVTAGGPRIPEPLVAQLADPGRLIMPVGGQEVQELQLVDKRDGDIAVTTIEQVRFVDLIGAHGWPN